MMHATVVRAALGVWVALFLGFSAWAQEVATAPDYAAWQAVAGRAEQSVETAEASEEALATLRAEIVGWREQFQRQLNANGTRIDALNQQIEALGPAPEDGAAEAAEIAERRVELAGQLERLTVPRRTAEEAFTRAAGIVNGIDAILRQRQTDQLLNMGPWPWNPAHWPGASESIRMTVVGTIGGIRQAWTKPTSRATAQDNLPLVIALTLLGLALLTRSRRWSELLALRIQNSLSVGDGGAAGFLVSLGQIFLPMLGLWALLRAVRATDLYGARAEVVLEALEPMGFALFVALWLASRVFPRSENLPTPVILTPTRRATGRVYAMVLGLVLAGDIFLDQITDFERFSAETLAVLNFPLLVAAGVGTFFLGWLLRRHLKDVEHATPDNQTFGPRVVRLLGRLAMFAGILAPLLAAAGYGKAAESLIFACSTR